MQTTGKVERFYEETLPTVGRKIDMLLTPSQKGQRSPVDCVAFQPAYVSTGEGNRVNGHYHAICEHPDRGGRQFGCLLTRQEEDGRIRRIRGKTCQSRVGKGRKGAVELVRRIRAMDEEKFPF